MAKRSIRKTRHNKLDSSMRGEKSRMVKAGAVDNKATRAKVVLWGRAGSAEERAQIRRKGRRS